MVPIKGEWTPFFDINDQIKYYRLWGLIPAKSKKLRPVMVVDGYFGVPEPCKVVGYQGENWAVIELPDGYHAIYGEHLAEIQPSAYQKMPFGVCFTEILEKYVVLDIETTGTNLCQDRIIKIAAASYEYGNKIDEYHCFVNPGILIPADIIDLTGISQSDVETAPSIETAASGFRDFIGGLPLIGHNISSFGMPFLSNQLPFQITNPIIDTVPMAYKAFDLLPCYTLAYLKTTLQLSGSNTHPVLADVDATNALLWACLSPRRYEPLVNKAFLDERLASPEAKQKAYGRRLDCAKPRDVIVIEQTNAITSASVSSSEKINASTKSYIRNETVSLAEIPPRYAVFDIETTGFDFHKDRVIELAAAIYEKGNKISEFSTFVDPGTNIPSTVVTLTGITREDVSGAPTIMSAASKFFNFVGDLTIVGHNIRSFDIPFLSAQTARKISNPIIDTLPMARTAFAQLPSHKLDYLKKILKLSNGASHRALADVETTNALLLACISPQQYEQAISQALLSSSPSSTTTSKKTAAPSSHKRVHSSISIKEIVPSCGCTDSASPLFGKNIVFTGELSIPRHEAMQMAVDAGGILKTVVSRKTNYLVVGQQDMTIVGMNGMSGKESSARALNESGKANIQIISEKEFLKLVVREGVTV